MGAKLTGNENFNIVQVGRRPVLEIDLVGANAISPGQSERLAGLNIVGAVGEIGFGIGQSSEDGNGDGSNDGLHVDG